MKNYIKSFIDFINESKNTKNSIWGASFRDSYEFWLEGDTETIDLVEVRGDVENLTKVNLYYVMSDGNRFEVWGSIFENPNRVADLTDRSKQIKNIKGSGFVFRNAKTKQGYFIGADYIESLHDKMITNLFGFIINELFYPEYRLNFGTMKYQDVDFSREKIDMKKVKSIK